MQAALQSTNQSPDALSGRVGSYELVRELGRGAMATVYEAEHLGLGKRVALKVLHAKHAGNSVAVARFAREGRVIARIRHPHVIDVTDVGTHDGSPYLVMELVNGTTLASLLEPRTALPLRDLVAIALPLLSAVSRAHAARVIHRDLKPSNVLLAVDRFGEVHPKVADFGVSKVADDDHLLTHEGGLVGTIAYMAPEQLRESRVVVPQSDQYSLGVILYQAATGVLPFREEATVALIHAILAGDPPAPSYWNPALPAAFDEILLRALDVDPEARHESVHAMGHALLRFASSRTWSTWSREFGGEQDASAHATLDDPTRVESIGAPAAEDGVRPRERSSRTASWRNPFVALALALGGVTGALGAIGSAGLTRSASLVSSPPPSKGYVRGAVTWEKIADTLRPEGLSPPTLGRSADVRPAPPRRSTRSPSVAYRTGDTDAPNLE